jgi:alpha-methylacyl-CoA racemase
MTAVIKRKTRHQWAAIFEGSEACVSPVLTMTEALHHPHAVAPQAFQTVEGVQQPRPVPRFSRTPAAPAEPPQATDANVEHALRAWGYSAGQVASLMQSKTVGLTGRRAHA